MENGFTISDVIPCTPSGVYEAWLDSGGHAAMTGSPAYVDGQVGGKFSAWDGYISGIILELTPNQRIVQAWRTSEFPDGAADSHLEVLFEEVRGGTKVTLIHTNLPKGQADSYLKGWDDFYFTPMKKYFGA